MFLIYKMSTLGTGNNLSYEYDGTDTLINFPTTGALTVSNLTPTGTVIIKLGDNNDSQFSIISDSGISFANINFLSSISLGGRAGSVNQKTAAIAIGGNAGETDQGLNSISIGINAANRYQTQNSIAVGNNAGYTTQNENSIAIGFDAAVSTQGTNSIAIGHEAGNDSQGKEAIAIGYQAGKVSQPDNSFFVAPTSIRTASVAGANNDYPFCKLNPTSGEVFSQPYDYPYNYAGIAVTPPATLQAGTNNTWKADVGWFKIDSNAHKEGGNPAVMAGDVVMLYKNSDAQPTIQIQLASEAEYAVGVALQNGEPDTYINVCLRGVCSVWVTATIPMTITKGSLLKGNVGSNIATGGGSVRFTGDDASMFSAMTIQAVSAGPSRTTSILVNVGGSFK